MDASRECLDLASSVKRLINSIDPTAKVYLFGSTVRGRHVPFSDIDILVITSKIDKKYDMIVKVYKEIQAPVELHVITNDLYEKWYKRFIPAEELIEIS
ncbi:MAG: nucleotidyltransferase domain-containing protein [Candidatus Methanomethylicaceae archaeon]